MRFVLKRVYPKGKQKQPQDKGGFVNRRRLQSQVIASSYWLQKRGGTKEKWVSFLQQYPALHTPQRVVENLRSITKTEMTPFLSRTACNTNNKMLLCWLCQVCIRHFGVPHARFARIGPKLEEKTTPKDVSIFFFLSRSWSLLAG